MVKLYRGDCLDVMRRLPNESVDAVVTDPPGAVSFMGKAWDSDRGGRLQWCGWLAERLTEARRVSKPGAYLLCWALPRTSHWTGCAIEDAGWRITDKIAHCFGSGFPKHKSKLKPAHEDWFLAWNPDRKATPLPGLDGCRVESPEGLTSGGQGPSSGHIYAQDAWTKDWQKTRARSEEHPSGRWPPNLLLSHSVNCRFVGTKRVNGTKTPGLAARGRPTAGVRLGRFNGTDAPPVTHADPDGTETVADWVCDESCPVRLMGEQSGERTSGGKTGGAVYVHGMPSGLMTGRTRQAEHTTIGDSGTAARFFPQFRPDPEPLFYAAKASRVERNKGCEGIPLTQSDPSRNASQPSMNGGKGNPHNRGCVLSPNAHPTVKSQALMRWLCRLITPPGGVLLDPFAGSGSTLCAAVSEGFDAVGIEQDRQWIPVIRRRTAAARKQAAALDTKA